VCLLCPHTSLDTGTQYGIKILHVVVYGHSRELKKKTKTNSGVRTAMVSPCIILPDLEAFRKNSVVDGN
jgi:hypothetical protein